jgi:hypothetical protein
MSSLPAAQSLAPIALFTFKRPHHTQRTLEGLATNPDFMNSPLFVFCDGARNAGEADATRESRRVVTNFQHPRKTVVEAPTNLGLANSIISGVTRLCNEFGRVIVVEDDLVVSPAFLNYMNTALDKYASDERVLQVTAHMWPVKVACKSDAFFMPITNSLGWGTWKRAWDKFDRDAALWPSIAKDPARLRQFDLGGRFPFSEMLKKQLRGATDSWAIRWYLTVFACNGLVLYPAKSLLVNIGFDDAGTHSSSVDQQRYGSEFSDAMVRSYPEVIPDDIATELVAVHLSKDGSMRHRILRRFRRFMARFA